MHAWPDQAGEEEGDEIFYTDKRGGRDHECLSLGCDHAPVLEGRTPLQTYADFIQEFASQCQANDLWGAQSYPAPCTCALQTAHAVLPTITSWRSCILEGLGDVMAAPRSCSEGRRIASARCRI